MVNTNLIVAIDDVHPEKDWGVEGDVQVEYLKELNKKYGVKFNLFCPSYYHNEYPLTKDWVSYWKQFDWIELSNHGHYHDVKKYTKEEIGEQEFLELNKDEAVDRVRDSLDLWEQCGHKPKGFRAPGWGISQEAADVVSENFEWVAQHEDINKRIKFNTKHFIGADGIHQSDDVKLYGNTFMFQSHIQGDWNDNTWNEENFNYFQRILDYLLSQFKIEFKTISEL